MVPNIEYVRFYPPFGVIVSYLTTHLKVKPVIAGERQDSFPK